MSDLEEFLSLDTVKSVLLGIWIGFEIWARFI